MASDGATLPLVTFLARYSEASMDQLQGLYPALNSLTRTPNPPLTAIDCLKGMVGQEVEFVPILVAPMVEEGHPHGRIRAILGLRQYRGVLGHPSPWDDRVFGFHTEYHPGMVGICELTSANCELSQLNNHSTWVPATLALTLERLHNLPDGELYLAPMAQPVPIEGQDVVVDETIVQGRARNVQAWPGCLAHLVVDQPATRREFFERVAPAIIDAGLENELPNLCTWLKMSVIRRTNAAGPHIAAIDNPAPMINIALVEWTQTSLRRILPDAFTTRNPEQSALVNLLVRQEENATAARMREEARAVAAKAPKTIAEVWTAARFQKACIMFKVSTSREFPPMHAKIAAALDKQKRLVVEECCKEAAAFAGHIDFAPLITPLISRRIQDNQWASHDMNDYTGGITVFMMIPPHLSTL